MASLTLLLMMFTGDADGSEASASSIVPEWRDVVNCGPLCLYAQLQIHGMPHNYRRVRDLVTIGSHGCSLLDLKRAAEQLGHKVTVRRCSLDDLTVDKLPAIIHMVDAERGGGHFKLLLSLDQDNAYVLDPVFAEVVPMSRQLLVRNWSGAALYVNAPVGSTLLRVVVAATTLFLLSCLAIKGIGFARRAVLCRG